MFFAPLVIAILLGLVEGVTEFLPVSSTGHLIVVGSVLEFTGQRAATFEIVIQLGAILAVVWHYRATLWSLMTRCLTGSAERQLTANLALGFLPAAVIGLLAHDWIKANLFSPITVAAALVIGGVIMLVLEWVRPIVTAPGVGEITRWQAFGIGCAQVLAMIPGTSRSAATILGGYGLGLSRSAATEFSFLLAIPTIIGAAGLDLVKSRDLLSSADVPMFVVGTLVAFVSALAVIRGFLRFIERHSFAVFAWYRIAFGGLLFLLFALRVM